jgi:hypothetical protein
VNPLKITAESAEPSTSRLFEYVLLTNTIYIKNQSLLTGSTELKSITEPTLDLFEGFCILSKESFYIKGVFKNV